MGGIYWLASYPKSGNTWLRIFLRNLIEDRDEPVSINDLGPDRIASARHWLDEVLAFDTADLTTDEIRRLRPDVYDWTSGEAHVGYHKIHDAYTAASDERPLVGSRGTLGAIYIVRHPLDVAPSLAAHWGCSIDEAISAMGRSEQWLMSPAGALLRQVPQRLLSWSEHVESWVDAPGLRREVVRYEDMVSDPQMSFTRCAAFLGLPSDPASIDEAVRFSSFRELARQEGQSGFLERPGRIVGPFFRRGESGGWRDTLSRDQVRQIVADHGAVMRRFGYLDQKGAPV